MNALQKTVAVIAILVLSTQTVRHAYLLWGEPRTSVLDKYDRPLQGEITQAASLNDLVRRYDPVRKDADNAREDLANGKRMRTMNELQTEPFKSERELRDAITDWERRSKEIHELRFYWLTGCWLLALGLVCYRKFNRWFGLTLMITGFAEFIYWTSPTFFGFSGGIREYDRLLVNKLAFSVISLVLVLATTWVTRIFAAAQETSKP
jgi:hypothetical protein